MFLGLRTVIYPAPDLEASKEWFTALLGVTPYFDEPFYVGYDVGGYELGLDPNAAPDEGPIIFWGVPEVDVALAALVNAGATGASEITDVGAGIKVATVREISGALLGIIENPNFELRDPPPEAAGPGR